MGLRNRSLFETYGTTFFVTTTVMNFDPIFSQSDKYNDIIIASLKFLMLKQNVLLVAYVIMPNHIHIVLSFPENRGLIDFMRDFKKYTSTKIRQAVEQDKNQLLLIKLKENAANYSRQKFKLWMDRYDDLVIAERHTLNTKIDYIHMNPVRAGLVNEPVDWKYSSARNYFLGDNSIIDVTPLIV